MPTFHAPLDRLAFSLSRCPKIRSRRNFADETIRFEEVLNELRILNAILHQQNAERGRHGAFFTLPGGGSLMTAQKTPSSLMALTNS